ncbi:iron-containing alcohol dehydrogenase [Sphingomonas lacunae]|uniref:Alcohol dehydrogenase 2 n=1 Tax=Sphingomonas lacunae TaxID=2698828 RepID=A0A6M4ARJ5_9SPHN|nr:iron-containing alcohol dehydrogenase [Sphingomonas lacunae]QJQ31060.1 iron-containing alcohol dehydrogenase [Sphingomonas lacunae]
MPRITRLGGGSLSELPEAMAQMGLCRPFIVTDDFIATCGLLDRLTGVLDKEGIGHGLFSETRSDPTTAVIESALAAMAVQQAVRSQAFDCIIGFGGGSPIDTAKAVALRADHAMPYADMKVPNQLDAPGLPIIAVPTTAGTGSEATRFTIITNEATSEKMLCAGLGLMPVIAIVDYELTLGKPARLTADTGIDSLTHAIEAYVSRRANAFSDAVALKAMRLIAANIRTACAEPGHHGARAAMMEGAHLAGIAFSNASVALVHGMSRPVGAFFHVPHGLSNAMLLPAVTAWSAPAALDRYADCARAMGVASDGEGDQAAVAALLHELAALNADLEVPGPADCGIEASQWELVIPVMAQQALASGSPGNNPRVPEAAEIEALYRQVWGA